jgi:hypothetical protein
MCHMLMSKFDDIMPLIRSCWWLQISFMRDARLESRFSPHIDTNYCVHKNFHQVFKYKSVSYVHHIFMFKLNDAMPLI